MCTPLIFPVAGCFAILLSFSPKFGALIQTIPGPLLGAVSVIVFGFIAAAGVRIMIENQIDLASSKNLIVTAVTLIIGAGDFSLKIGGFGLGGIGTATIAAILLNLIMEDKKLKKSNVFLSDFEDGFSALSDRLNAVKTVFVVDCSRYGMQSATEHIVLR